MVEHVPLKEIREALYARLRGDLAVTAPLAEVWPYAAEPTTQKPAVIITQYTARGSAEYGFKGVEVFEVAATIEVGDELDGDERVEQTIDAILQAITREPMVAGEYEEVRGALEHTEVGSAWTGDRAVLKGQVRYSWVVQRRV